MANAFVFCQDTDDLAQMLASLKYDDPEFLSKIRMITSNYDSKLDASAVSKRQQQLPVIIEKTSTNINIRSTTIEDVFKERYNKVYEFMRMNNRQHSRTAEAEKFLGVWTHGMNNNYKSNRRIMQIPEIRSLWSKLREDFPSCFKDRIWDAVKESLAAWMIKNKTRPNQKSTEKEERRLAQWLSAQIQSHKAKTMLFEYREKWEAFRQEFSMFLMTPEELYDFNKNKVIQFITAENKKPVQGATDDEERFLGSWLNNRSKDYKKNKMTQAQRRDWENLKQKFPDILMTLDEFWHHNLAKLDAFMDEHKRKPSSTKQSEKQLCQWMQDQNKTYKQNKMPADRRALFEKLKTKYNI